MKKCYWWSIGDIDDGNLVIIAENNKDAKKLGWTYTQENGWDGEYIEVRCKQMKGDFKIDGLPYGVCDDGKELLGRGIVSSLFNCDCETCDYNGVISYLCAGKLLCDDCYEKLNEDRK